MDSTMTCFLQYAMHLEFEELDESKEAELYVP